MFRIQIELESVWWSYSKCGERSNFPIWSCCIALLLWLLLASLWPVLLCQHFSRSRIWISGKKDLSLIFCLLTCHHLHRRTKPHAELPSSRERGPDTLSVATIRIVHFSKVVILRCKLFLSSQTGRTKFFLLNFKGLQCFQTTIGLTRSLMFLMPKIYKVNSNLGQSFGTSIHFQSFNFIHHFWWI